MNPQDPDEAMGDSRARPPSEGSGDDTRSGAGAGTAMRAMLKKRQMNENDSSAVSPATQPTDPQPPQPQPPDSGR